MKEILKKIIPNWLLSFYHLLLAYLAAYYYGFPSNKLIVIGVTGTKGKTTTANLLVKLLEAAGHKVGLTSTLNFKIGQAEWLSDRKMTMPGRFYLQKLLRRMVKNGCRFAVVETSSEGIAQFRHRGIWYDAVVFTNLSPEHLEAHGGFENYKAAKLELLKHLEKLPHKNLPPPLLASPTRGEESFLTSLPLWEARPPASSLAGEVGRGLREGAIPKVIVANADNEHAADFLNFKVDKKITFGVQKKADFQAKDIKITPSGISYKLPASPAGGQATSYKLSLLGKFDVYNSLAAIAAASVYDVSPEVARAALAKVSFLPGRLEKIPNHRGLTIVVDYAHEPESLRQVYETLAGWKYRRLIHVLGPTGGGRDRWRRPVLGEMAAQQAAIVIVTTDDPYDDDPKGLMQAMAAGARQGGKLENQNLFLEPDRRRAIGQALAMAKQDDLVLITGKGAEQVMAVAHGRKIPWDDRAVVREELLKLEARNPKSETNLDESNSKLQTPSPHPLSRWRERD